MHLEREPAAQRLVPPHAIDQPGPEAVEIILGEIPPAVRAVEADEDRPARPVELRGQEHVPPVLVLHPRVAVAGQDRRAGAGPRDGEAPVHARQAGQDRPVADRVGVELEDRVAAALGRQFQGVGGLRAEPHLGLGPEQARLADDRQDSRPVAAGPRVGVGRLRRAAANRARRRRRSARPPPGRRSS